MYISENIKLVLNNISRLKKERGWNSKKLSIESGIDQGQISRYEKGNRYISFENLERLAKAFDIEIYELFYYRNPEEYSMRDKLELIQTLHPLKQELIETMINAFLKEQEMENTKS